MGVLLISSTSSRILMKEPPLLVKWEAVHQKMYEEGTPSQLFLSNSTEILSRIIGLSNIVRALFGRTPFGGFFYTNISL